MLLQKLGGTAAAAAELAADEAAVATAEIEEGPGRQLIGQ